MYRLLTLLFLSQCCFAQTATKVLVVELENEHILFEQTSKKVLQRNRVSEDSARKLIGGFAVSRLKSNLTACEIVWSAQFPELNFLKDSAATFEQFTTFYYQGIAKNKGLGNAVLQTNKDIRKLYFGRVFTDKAAKNIKQVIAAQKIDYLILINRFDINAPGFFPNQICYHVEVYDKEMQLVFGGKSNTANDFSKKVYFGVLNYYYKNAADDVFRQVHNVLKP